MFRERFTSFSAVLAVDLKVFDGVACGCWCNLCCLIGLRDFDDNAADVSWVLTRTVELCYFHFEPIEEIAGYRSGFRTTDA